MAQEVGTKMYHNSHLPKGGEGPEGSSTNNNVLNSTTITGTITVAEKIMASSSLTDAGNSTFVWQQGGQYAGGSYAFSSLGQTLSASDSYTQVGFTSQNETSNLYGTLSAYQCSTSSFVSGLQTSQGTVAAQSNNNGGQQSSSSSAGVTYTVVSSQSSLATQSGFNSSTQINQGAYGNNSYAFTSLVVQAVQSGSVSSQQTTTAGQTLMPRGP